MFRNLTKTLALSVRTASTAAPKEKWDLCVGVLVERLPIIARDLSEIELEMSKTLSQIEFENSLKSDHELRKEKDLVTQKLIKAGKIQQDLDDTRQLQTAQDVEDLYQEELAKFQAAPRITEDDKKNNLKSLNRKLDDTLLLICAHNVDKKDVLLLPQAKWVEGETLRQTAERIVREKCGPELKVHFYGHAPCGFYKNRYKDAKPTDAVGVKTFFYRAIYKNGEVAEKSAKFEWVNEEELKGKVRSSYYQSVSQFLVS